ncbi:MAG: hypothetical protein ACREVB_05890 [Burkholderiales bacterium]
MEDVEFSDEFCRFVQVHVPSVEAAERLIAAPPPDDPALKAHVQTLVQAYEQRPVTLFRLIYALRDGKIRSFADAFKLRKS